MAITRGHNRSPSNGCHGTDPWAWMDPTDKPTALPLTLTANTGVTTWVKEVAFVASGETRLAGLQEPAADLDLLLDLSRCVGQLLPSALVAAFPDKPALGKAPTLATKEGLRDDLDDLDELRESSKKDPPRDYPLNHPDMREMCTVM